MGGKGVSVTPPHLASVLVIPLKQPQISWGGVGVRAESTSERPLHHPGMKNRLVKEKPERQQKWLGTRGGFPVSENTGATRSPVCPQRVSLPAVVSAGTAGWLRRTPSPRPLVSPCMAYTLQNDVHSSCTNSVQASSK